jgi:putative cell wall-binding protein
MNKKMLSLLICCLFHITAWQAVNAQQQQQQPDYEKWGRIAVAVVKENYPDSEIIDYKHLGQQNVSVTQSKHTFTIEVKHRNQTFNVKVVVTYNPRTDRLISVGMEEIRQ